MADDEHFRATRADSVFGRVTKRHDDGAITVHRIDGKEQVIEAREARRCASCRVGDFVEHELRYDKDAQRQVATRARPLESVRPFGAEVRGCDLILHAYTGDRHRAPRALPALSSRY
jgi:hypothetical protein